MRNTTFLLCILALSISFAGCDERLNDRTERSEEVEAVLSPEPAEPADGPRLEQPPQESEDETPAAEHEGEVVEENKGGMSKEQRITDAKMVIGLFERGYAPRLWKEELFDTSFQSRSDELLDWAGQDISDLDFYGKIGEYVADFHDSHTSHAFPSTLLASLPFDVDEVEERIIVTSVDDELSELRAGDELISLCGEDPEDELSKIMPYVGEGNPRAEMRLATTFLTRRGQWTLPHVPQGKCTVTFKSRSDGSLNDVEMEWNVEGHEMAELNNPPPQALKSTKVKTQTISYTSMNILEQSRIRIHPLRDRMQHLRWGDPKPFITLWDSFEERKAEPFLIGTFEIEDKKIGFIRIHAYSGLDPKAAIRELAQEIPYLEDNTEALVIDQTGNAGGSVCFGLDIASFFFTTPQKELHDRWRANRDNLTYFEMTAEMSENENDRILAEEIAENMREAMKRGDVLTDHFPICNHDGVFQPYTNELAGGPWTYTKPVLLLIDELAASAGDYFPALMQDLGRVVTFGKSTIGAGGAIKFIGQTIGYSEIQLSLTISLGWREPAIELPNGLTTHYIENVGVMPDIEYDITVDDVVNGYLDYRDAVDLSVLSLIKDEENTSDK